GGLVHAGARRARLLEDGEGLRRRAGQVRRHRRRQLGGRDDDVVRIEGAGQGQGEGQVTRGACTLATLLIASCARTPANAPGGHWQANLNIVHTVAFGGGGVYALRYDRRVRLWPGGAQPQRTLPLEHVGALASAASVAATTADEGQGDRLEVWSLPAATRLHARSFAQRIGWILAVSP